MDTQKLDVLIVDDEVYRHDAFAKIYSDHNVVHAYTYQQAIDALESQEFDIIQLDHDLGDYDIECREWTGHDVAKVIAAQRIERMGKEPFRLLTVIIHSWNPHGANNIRIALIGTDIRAIKLPFSG